jgi:predicted Zn-dependent protease
MSAARGRTDSVTILLLCASASMALVTEGCRSVPVTGRRQVVLMPESQEIQLGEQAYEQTLAEESISQNAELAEMVERVGRRIAAVSGKPEYDWEFRVIAKDVQNAFALPGGKVAIYEGILPICQSEAGVAVVMSHEIAHAIARHGGERMAHQSGVKAVGWGLDAVAKKQTDGATAEMIMKGYGVTSKYGIVYPYSRKHESEADAIGLILMAKAGYDPSVAPEFWERFSKVSGSKPHEWLSTHPADARRAADLRAMMPEAMKYYEAAEVQLGMGDPLPVPSGPSNEVRLAKALQPPAGATMIGTGTGKRTAVEQALHTMFAEKLAEEAEESAAAEPVDSLHFPGANASDFKLPIRTGIDDSDTPAVPEVGTVDPLGWESSGN